MINIVEDGRRIIDEEIIEILNISSKYKPEKFGGNPASWDNYHQMQEDIYHLSALLVSISPVIGETLGQVQDADYAREIERDRIYGEERRKKDELTGKKNTHEEALRKARGGASEYYKLHAKAIKESQQLNKLSYYTGILINSLNEALKRETIERRRDQNG